MNKILKFLLFIVSNLLFSQSNILTYKVKIIPEENHIEYKNNFIFYEAADIMSNNLEYKLIFNDSISLFEMSNFLEDYYNSELAFRILNKKTFFQNNLHFYIDDPMDVFPKDKYILKKFKIDNWLVTENTKIINGFECKKALLFKKDDILHEDEVIATAWFTTMIPLGFGPLEYGNLPGIILEIHVGLLKYYAIDIDLNSLQTIEMPFHGKILGESEYNKEFDKFMDSFTDN